MFGHFFLMFLHVPHLSSTFSTVGTLDGFKQIWRLCICIYFMGASNLTSHDVAGVGEL